MKAASRVEKALDKETGLSPETRSALKGLMEALKTEPETKSPFEPAALARETRAGPAQKEKSKLEKFLERLTPYGDFRLREEYSFNLDDQPDWNRVRVRFRLGMNYEINDEILVGVRLRTGNPDDPNSPHQTLGSVFDSFELNLDRAFVKYEPHAVEGLQVTVGKFHHPFWRNPVYAELIWDGDVQPEGAAAGYVRKWEGRITKTEFWIGEYLLEEQRFASEALMTVLQTAVHADVTEHVSASAGLGYYHYHDTTPDSSPAIIFDNGGNAIVFDGAGDPKFENRFGILNPIVAATCDAWVVPVTVSAEFITNTLAGGGRNLGWGLGFKLGKTRKQGDWDFFYQWGVVEQDAIFTAFANDDFVLQGNRRGHVVGGNYMLFDNVGLKLWGLVAQRDRRERNPANPLITISDSDANQWRLRADINIKF